MIQGPKIDDVEDLDLWFPKPMKGIKLHILGKEEFDRERIIFNLGPATKAFAVWSWWRNDIYVMPHTLYLIPHEVRHLQERENFHG